MAFYVLSYITSASRWAHKVQWERRVALIRCSVSFWVRSVGSSIRTFVVQATRAAPVLLFNYWISPPLRSCWRSSHSSLFHPPVFSPVLDILTRTLVLPPLLLPLSIFVINPVSPLQLFPISFPPLPLASSSFWLGCYLGWPLAHLWPN